MLLTEAAPHQPRKSVLQRYDVLPATQTDSCGVVSGAAKITHLLPAKHLKHILCRSLTVSQTLF